MIPRSTFTVEVYEHGIGIRGSIPADLFPGLAAMGESRGYDLMNMGVASAMGLLLFITDKAGGSAAEAEIERRNAGLPAVEAWLRGTDTGLSSRSIVRAITGLGDGRGDVPHDPDDFGRCHRLLERVPELRPRLPEVADRYPAWAPLVAAWDELTALYLEELPTGRCPRLYARMRELRGEGS